ncbi:hypothetical protein NPIL_702951 [Nephila pilipes]|uniref:Uncharacterized protein n=1 Tax=Nephila pilipes TaxID=299642 RepID=A0A8X6N1A9_NEPPI|nr:hypothetical protein NPIL_702951 [Nephila pilipes]
MQSLLLRSKKRGVYHFLHLVNNLLRSSCASVAWGKKRIQKFNVSKKCLSCEIVSGLGKFEMAPSSSRSGLTPSEVMRQPRNFTHVLPKTHLSGFYLKPQTLKREKI